MSQSRHRPVVGKFEMLVQYVAVGFEMLALGSRCRCFLNIGAGVKTSPLILNSDIPCGSPTPWVTPRISP